MSKQASYSEEQMDYLRELFNIGMGHAASALSQLLGCEVEEIIPRVKTIPSKEAYSLLSKPSLYSICARMNLVGEVNGTMFFILPYDQKKVLLSLATAARPGQISYENEASVFEEISNIIAGVFLTSIHDFSGLNIYHSVPVLATDMAQSLLDEVIAAKSMDSADQIIVEIELVVKASETINCVMTLIPFLDYSSIMNSMETVKRGYGMK